MNSKPIASRGFEADIQAVIAEETVVLLVQGQFATVMYYEQDMNVTDEPGYVFHDLQVDDDGTILIGATHYSTVGIDAFAPWGDDENVRRTYDTVFSNAKV